jgi:hypothetical protein
MTTHAAPYCTTGDVYLMRLFMMDPNEVDFQAGDTPSPATVTFWVNQIASRIDAAYHSAGYVVPFESFGTETWPTWQTTFLRHFNAVGVAALIGGDASHPRVTEFVQGERGTRSFYESEWTTLIEGVIAIGQGRVRESMVAIRAEVYAGSPAQVVLREPMPPLVAFTETYSDPRKFDNLREYTRRHDYYAQAMNLYNEPTVSNEASWDFLWLLRYRMGMNAAVIS